MQRSGRAWIILPAVIVAIAVIGLLVSNFQKEAGITEPSKGGTAAVAAAVAARDASQGTGADDYRAFNEALLVAAVARKNAPLFNPADTRLNHVLVQALDCLAALREAWQTEIDQTWNRETHGTAAYWSALHPALEMLEDGPLTAGDVRRICEEQAATFLEKAINLVS